MALSERQLQNLWNRLDQLRVLIAAAEQNLANALAAGHTQKETRTIRAEITRLTKERQKINDRLAADAAESREDPPGDKTKSKTDKKPTTGGTGMSLAENRAMLMSANDGLGTAQGQITAARSSVEDAQGLIMNAASDIDSMTAPIGLVAQALEELETAAQAVAAAISETEEYIGRIS
jgi:hypothetical protein